VLIYAIRILHPELSSFFPIPSLARQILADVSAFPVNSAFFKGIVWPTFIAGVETADPELREQAQFVLGKFYGEFRFMNIKHAKEMLERVWRESDAGAGEGGGEWMRRVARGGEAWLFI
jgi:hypothetical protein